MIQSVNSNTSLTLDKLFAETTATNSNYRILLNTAAHFPSDTAAKVERALEQLSDINEAAINNDRTVTAATKVNGKGINSTTGNILLYPNSVNDNHGGCINFHYNQSNNTTSSIYEDASGRIRLSGNINITGKVLSNVILEGTGTPIRLYNMNPTSGVVQRFIQAYDDNGSTGVGAVVYTTYPEASEHNVRLRANNAGTYADLGVTTLSDGTRYAFAPTYSEDYNDNSGKIATTGFIRGMLTYGYNGDVNLRTTSSAAEAGTSVSRTLYFNNGDSNAAHRLAMFRGADLANGGHRLEICALHYFNNATSFNTMTFETDANNNKSIRINTPATSDNSSQIATTAFVNNRLPYTSGTWTPTCYGYTTAGSTTISGNNCRYVKIGKLVIINVSFTFTVKTAPTGQVRIGGLPFTCDKNAYGLFWSSGHTGYILTASSNVLYIRNVANSIPYLVSWGTSTWDNTVDSTGNVEGSIVYFTA